MSFKFVPGWKINGQKSSLIVIDVSVRLSVLTMSSGEITNRFAEDSISETVLSQNHEFVLLSRLQVLHCHLRDFRVLNRNRLPILRVHQTVPDVVFDCGSSDTWKRGEMLSPL